MKNVQYLLIVLVISCLGNRTPEVKPWKSAVVDVTVLQESGGRVSWLHKDNLIAFDKKGNNGYFDIYVVNLDGSQLQCLTCDTGWQLHNGNPEWHPSGEYLVFQVQDPDLEGLPPGPMGVYVASPGVGIHNNIWMMTADGLKFWQLTNVKDRHGCLHPHFSPDGTKLLWSEIISPHMDRIGHWVIKLADFSLENGEPRLSNVQTLQPGTLQLYEVHGFSPDGKTILFSGIVEGGYYYDMEIYSMDVTTGECIKLTDNSEWDEHAHFTKDGRIIWVSSEGIPQVKGNSLEDTVKNPPKLEYWIMNEDGSSKRRLSGFNNPDAPEYVAVNGGAGLGDFDVGPDGTTIVAKMRRGHSKEIIIFIEFNLEGDHQIVLQWVMC